MGCLRIYLAIIVVFGHTIGQISIGSTIAVELFFLISGFLIANVLSRHSYETYSSYLASRLLRLFPLYWLILVLTFLYRIVTMNFYELQNIDSTNFKSAFEIATTPLVFVLILANVFIVFQDIVLFINTDGANYGLVGVSNSSQLVTLQPALIVPQAWSLSLEIYFYILAPLLHKFKIALFFLFGLSITSLVIVSLNGLGNSDPWSYRFFPSELSLFLLGMLTFKYSRYINISNYFKPLLFTYCLFLLTFGLLDVNRVILKVVLILFTILLIPELARINRVSKIDALLGKLSFPVYLIHFLVIQVFTSLQMFLFSRSNSYLTCLVTLILSIFLSVLANRYLLDPIDAVRARFKSRDK